MRFLLRSILFVALACLVLAAGSNSQAAARDCRPEAMARLPVSAPDGFAVYQKTKDKKFFLHWIACD